MANSGTNGWGGRGGSETRKAGVTDDTNGVGWKSVTGSGAAVNRAPNRTVRKAGEAAGTTGRTLVEGVQEMQGMAGMDLEQQELILQEESEV